MADTSMKQRPVAGTPRTTEVAPAPKETRRPPPERPRRFVRWIEYAAIVLVLGAAAVIGIFMLRGGEDEVAFETFDRHELAEAAALRAQAEPVGSGLSIGERHTNPDFAVEQRWVGESGATLEEVEAVGALAIVPVTPVSYESNVALREVGALAVVPITPVSYESHAALREAGAVAVVPITPVSYESHAALREALVETSFDTFETTYEANSGLSMGARHTDSEFDVGVRFGGESDMTLEEFELSE